MAINKLTKPSTRDAFQSIWNSYQFPVSNRYINIINWIPSQDVQDGQILTGMELQEEFVESVAKSEGLAIIFEKSINGAKIKKKSPLIARFYALLWPYNIGDVNSGQSGRYIFPSLNIDRIQQHKYEISENLKILHNFASKQLNRACFSGDPTSIIGLDGLQEGDLINTLVSYLQETTKQKGFQAKVTERKNESTLNFKKTKKYINQLHANNSGLYGVRMVICYQSEYANSITLKESVCHLQKYLESFETELATYSHVGWWWKREYMTEVGYRYFLILFFDGQKTPYNPREIQGVYGNHWISVTEGRGRYFVPEISERDYDRSGMESLLLRYSERKEGDLGPILASTQCMLMRDIFLRLERSKKFDHFGMG